MSGSVASVGLVRATVFYLLNGVDAKQKVRASQMMVSLRSAVKHMLSKYASHYWVTVFHTREATDVIDREALTALWPRTQLANLTAPPFPRWAGSEAKREKLRRAGKWLQCAGRVWEAGYMKTMMIRTLSLWTHSALDHFDYFMSLDTDIYFERTFPFDPFLAMQTRQLAYAYHECGFESGGDCLESLGKTVWDYATVNNVSGGLEGLDVHPLYAGNFGVGEVAFFRSKEYQDFATHLLSFQNYYARRWADQNIWVYALAMFAAERVEHWHTLYDEAGARSSVRITWQAVLHEG